jgi:virulence-associated protein VapD
MAVTHDWPHRSSRYLKAELKRQGVTYDDLATRLNEMGFEETKASVANKISRGAFTAAFFLASLRAVGTQSVRIEDV